MPFELTDAHHDEYHRNGFTIFRGIVPLKLLIELRREADKGRAIARARGGENTQRLQPLRNHQELDMTPFKEFANLPAINDALKAVVSPNIFYGLKDDDRLGALGVLYEPATRPWCTQWHRDWRDNAPGLDIKLWQDRLLDPEMFNQVNCALYEDTCTWVVPGSHIRRDTSAEIRRFPERPIAGPAVPESASVEEAELICLGYTASMPGAVQAHLNPGDFMLYRNSLWHIGNYAPYKRRATIHDVIGSPAFSQWFQKPPMLRDKDGKPLPMQNANLETAEYKAWEKTRKPQPA
ncbi:MAG: phytanoyl-CoA dioxygenase family protein [Planctomycetota bacterium]|nr:phytanoyl-CoA dioxygenase family protein [Planctomycetota bacterium]